MTDKPQPVRIPLAGPDVLALLLRTDVRAIVKPQTQKAAGIPKDTGG